MRVVIFGCGGHARSIAGTIIRNDKKAEILFIDSNAETEEKIMGFMVQRDYSLKKDDTYIIAVGDNSRRKKIYNSLHCKNQGECISVVSNAAYIGIAARIGIGTFVGPFAYIAPFSQIGNNTIINTGSIIEHETVIGNHTHIAPRATICGRSKIGDNVLCGAGSTIIDKVTICDNVIIGAGAVITENIVESGTYVGVPARRIC